MVQISNFLAIVAVAASSAGFVSAKNCKNGGVYCGGDYTSKINDGLTANGLEANAANTQNSLWNCVADGGIQFKQLCNSICIGGDKNDDYCG
ncbi:hypothetical protein NUW58_g2602 [Xylaria curta]|uniref:Uncharacterized protein n=2 Tax=Xylaria curta TaxID=42375 RepID=A0ACC1PGC7_9PEZI|nr:hypothetical protein NUW58_g2973 [Xylaria curta]KAJ2991197.1 hypothetical protein NUW58_g2602 [Xylaria curta]